MPPWSHRNVKTVRKRQANDFPVCGKRSSNLLRTFYGCPAGDVPSPPLHYVFIKKGFTSFILSNNQTIKVNPSLKQPSQGGHRKNAFHTVAQRFTVNLQPSFTKKKNQMPFMVPVRKNFVPFHPSLFGKVHSWPTARWSCTVKDYPYNIRKWYASPQSIFHP